MSAESLRRAIALLAVAAAFTALLMAAVHALSRRWRNAGIVDVAWAAGFTPVALLYACFGLGYAPRRALLAALVSFWSLRLAGHLYHRLRAQHPQEDRRYARLRTQWGAHAERNMFWFFELQALLLVVLSTPLLLVAQNPATSLRPIEYVGAAIWVIALLGETLADRQLQRFRSEPMNATHVCQIGLWRYSRHPNYFFEWLVWVAYAVFACGTPLGWSTLYCPALMLYLLLRVTGVPLTEELSLQNKGSAYADYQRSTSVFVPWVRNKSQTTR